MCLCKKELLKGFIQDHVDKPELNHLLNDGSWWKFIMSNS